MSIELSILATKAALDFYEKESVTTETERIYDQLKERMRGLVKDMITMDSFPKEGLMWPANIATLPFDGMTYVKTGEDSFNLIPSGGYNVPASSKTTTKNEDL